MGKARNPYGQQGAIGALERGLLNALRAPVHLPPTPPPPQRLKKITAPTPPAVAVLIPWKSLGVYWAYWVPDTWTVGVDFPNYGNTPVTAFGECWVDKRGSGANLFFSRTQDRGATNQDVALPEQPSSTSVILSFDDNGRLWFIGLGGASNLHELYYSDDLGDTWTLKHSFTDVDDFTFYTIFVDPTGQYFILYCIDGFGETLIYTSIDSATTWTRSTPTTSSPATPSTGLWTGSNFVIVVYEDGTNDILIMSSPDGTAWTERVRIASGPDYLISAQTCTQVLADGTPVIAFNIGGLDGIYRSTDGGVTWAFVALTGGATIGDMVALGKDLYIFDNGGGFWKLANAKTSGGAVTTLAAQP